GGAPGAARADDRTGPLRLLGRRADRRGIAMGLIALGALALLVRVWMGRRGGALVKRREWRIGAGASSLAALAGAALLGFREAWIPAVGLLILSVWLAVAARKNAAAPAPPEARSSRMSLKEARSILGVGA